MQTAGSPNKRAVAGVAGGLAAAPGLAARLDAELAASRPDDLAAIAFRRRALPFPSSLVPWVGATVATAYVG